ncbi:hypothetical protein D3C77_364680 [compost metagenome]
MIHLRLILHLVRHVGDHLPDVSNTIRRQGENHQLIDQIGLIFEGQEALIDTTLLGVEFDLHLKQLNVDLAYFG